MQSYNPEHAVTCRFGLLRCSLATTYGITIVFSSYGYLDVSVPHVRFILSINSHPSDERVAPFGNLRINSDCAAPPRSLSQLITSFFASETLGIPRAPLSNSTFFLFSVFLHHVNVRSSSCCIATKPLKL